MTVPGPENATMPRGAFDALRARWDGVELGGQLAKCDGDLNAVPLVTGDLNGDGSIDTAVWVRTGETARLAAVFSRLAGEYLVFEVSAPDGRLPAGRLELIRRGTFVRTPAGQFDPYLGLDTISLRQCDGSRELWFWTGEGFRPQPLAD